MYKTIGKEVPDYVYLVIGWKFSRKSIHSNRTGRPMSINKSRKCFLSSESLKFIPSKTFGILVWPLQSCQKDVMITNGYMMMIEPTSMFEKVASHSSDDLVQNWVVCTEY